MKHLFSVALLAGVMVGAAHAQSWFTDFDKGAAEAKRTGKPMLVDFTGSDWCTWCIRLHKEVFDKPEFKSWAKGRVVLVSLDFPQTKQLPAAQKARNEALAKKYRIQGFPTVLFLKPDGTQIGDSGYLPGGPAKWTADADKKLKSN